jgi:hypothetical protein
MVVFWIWVAFMVGLTSFWAAAAWTANDRFVAITVGTTSFALLAMSVAAFYG